MPRPGICRDILIYSVGAIAFSIGACGLGDDEANEAASITLAAFPGASYLGGSLPPDLKRRPACFYTVPIPNTNVLKPQETHTVCTSVGTTQVRMYHQGASNVAQGNSDARGLHLDLQTPAELVDACEDAFHNGSAQSSTCESELRCGMRAHWSGDDYETTLEAFMDAGVPPGPNEIGWRVFYQGVGGDYSELMDHIQREIDNDRPALLHVRNVTGVFKEGYHVMIIVGYDASSNEIVVLDNYEKQTPSERKLGPFSGNDHFALTMFYPPVGAHLSLGQRPECVENVAIDGALCPENTVERCSDGVDNDSDNAIDCDDPDCRNFQHCRPREGSHPECSDGIDNDMDGDIDCDDSGCAVFCAPPEDNITACNDGIDNDLDSYVDCDDPGCCSVFYCRFEPICN